MILDTYEQGLLFPVVEYRPLVDVCVFSHLLSV